MTKEVDEILKERDRFAAEMRDSVRQASAETDERATEDPKELVDLLTARLENATRARAEAVARFDEEIEHHKQMIEKAKAKAKTKAEGGPKRAPRRPRKKAEPNT